MPVVVVLAEAVCVSNDEALDVLRGLKGSRVVLGGVEVDAGVGNSYAGSVVGMNGRSWEALRGKGEVVAGVLAMFPAMSVSSVVRTLLLVTVELERRSASVFEPDDMLKGVLDVRFRGILCVDERQKTDVKRGPTSERLYFRGLKDD